MYEVSMLASRCLDAATNLNYETLFDGPPELFFDGCRSIAVQRTSGYPSELVTFSRKPFKCRDGFFREPSRAMQEYLIDIGFISELSDCCSNIPWKFFINQSQRTQPFDRRVVRILKALEDRGYSKSKVFGSFRGWNGQGAPDITDFGAELQCVEIKFFGDALGANQINFHKRLQSLGIETTVIELKESDRTGKEYRELRSAHRQQGTKIYSDFWLTKAGQKVEAYVAYHLKRTDKNFGYLNPWIINSRRNGLDEIQTFKQRPSSLVKTLCICLRNEKAGCKVIFTEEEVATLANTLYKAGTHKWWIVPIILTPWLAKGSEVNDFTDLLHVALRWEETFRTEFWIGRPSLGHFESNLGYRSKPSKLPISASKLTDLYSHTKTSKNNGLSTAIQKRFEFLWSLGDGLEITRRDRSLFYEEVKSY